MRYCLQCLAALVVGISLCSGGEPEAPVQLHVATGGNDAWSGRLPVANRAGSDGPLATLHAARDALRNLRAQHALARGAEVLVHGGLYVLDKTWDLTSEDSGTETAGIVYRAAGDGPVRLLGGRVVSAWAPVADESIRQQLDPAARPHVVQADLKQLGIIDFGSAGGGGLELFFADQPMTVARWPNEGFVRIVEVLGPTEKNVRGTKGCAEGIFRYAEDRPARWLHEKDAWVHGYWFWDWAEQRHRIQKIDTAQRTIEVQPPYHNYGYRKGQWFYAFNLLVEIDQPGEWYLDRDTGMLYFWPPAAIESGEALVSVLPSLITLRNTSYVTLRGFTIEAVRHTALTVSAGTTTRIVACTFRNLGDWAVRVSGGTDHGVVGCDMYQMGGGGVALSGGDRQTLEPAGHFAENNHIHHFARIKRVYQPGITLQGVGNRATRNLIHDAPHMAMGFGGNDHLIEGNEIHHVCYESNDAGAIYAGRNWTTRGTVIRNNYMHHVTGFEDRGCVGVYLDDMYCGTEISGNVFYQVTRAAFVGGGRDCLIANNLFVDCRPALHIDGRALGWAKYHAEQWVQEAREKGTLSGTRYNKPPYSVRYPQLPNILADEPFAPKGNVIRHNVSWGGKWDGVYAEARKYVTFEDNLVDTDPLFATPDRIGTDRKPQAVDFQLREDSPAWSIGFKKLPLDKIGLYSDADRAVRDER